MTRIQPLGRSIEQLSRPTRPSHVCRSCRLRLAGSQQRQLHTSGNETSSPGHAPSSTSTASNDTDSRSHENAKAATWNVVSSKQLRRRVSKNSLPLTLVAKDPSKDPDYVQAVSSEGLERVGSRKWIEKQLDVRDRYVGFSKERQSKLSKKVVTALLLEAVSTSGKEQLYPRPGQPTTMARAGFSPDDVTSDESTGPSAETTSKEMEQSLATSEVEEAATAGLDEAEEEFSTTEQLQHDDSGLSMSVTDTAFKLQITKFMLFKTGIRISDFIVYNAKTLSDLRDAYIKPPQPKTLAQQLSMAEQLQQLPNVKIAARRITPIDKEKAVGRWKLIEQELEDRGLPVTGHTTFVKRPTVEEYGKRRAKR